MLSEVEKVIRGENDRLMIFMPPGSAKSLYASKLAMLWAMTHRPGMQIIGASHTVGYAEDVSIDAQRYLRDHAAILGYSLTRESAGRWATTNGGQYIAAGVGMGIAGVRADGAIIDDPVRSRADAESETYRDRAWQWFQADLGPRLKPGGWIILIQTRWHEDDLAGRLLATQPEQWRVLNLPALATSEDDPLGRDIGEPLWTDDAYGYGTALLRIKDTYEKSGGMRDWQSLYQQDPRPAEGALFKVAQIEVLPTAPAGGRIVRAWDLAATKQVGTRDPDWTVGVKLARYPNGKFVVLDVTRFRGGPDEVEAAIRNVAQQDGRAVQIDLPQDPGQAGKAQIAYLVQKLVGMNVKSSPETGDKSTRAAPVASQVNVGNLAIVAAGWNRAFLDELSGFPAAAKDDQVDALSRAFAALVGSPTLPPMIGPVSLMQESNRVY